MTESLVAWVLYWAGKIPVLWFAFFGSIVEEIISPIPSPLIMTTVGSSLAARDGAIWHLAVGSIFLATLGKVLGYWVIYILSDRIEDVVMRRLGKKIGVTHEQIESVGKLFSRTWRDDVFVFIVRFLPIMPSAPITVTAGVLKLPVVRFMTASFLGTWMRNTMYLAVGYVGIEAFTGLVSGYESSKVYLQIALGLFLVSIILWAVRQRRRNGIANSAPSGEASSS